MNSESDKPPVFRSWRGWYWLVIAVMLAQMLVYLWMTKLYQ